MRMGFEVVFFNGEVLAIRAFLDFLVLRAEVAETLEAAVVRDSDTPYNNQEEYHRNHKHYHAPYYPCRPEHLVLPANVPVVVGASIFAAQTNINTLRIRA